MWPLDRIVIGLMAIQMLCCVWKDSDYLVWSIWVIAMGAAWFLLAFRLLGEVRFIKRLKAEHRQCKFWSAECERLIDKLDTIPEWDKASRDETGQQFRTATFRLRQQVATVECLCRAKLKR